MVVLQCYGYKASLCKVYSTNGLLESPNVDSSEVKSAHEAQQKDGRGAQPCLRNFKKKSKATFQQNEMNGTSPSEVNEMTAITDESIESGVLETPKTLVVIALGGSPFILIDGEPLRFPGQFLQTEILSASRYLMSIKCYKMELCSMIRSSMGI